MFRTCSGRVQGVFGTCSGRVRDVFGTCSGRVRDVFGMCSGHVRDAFGTRSGRVREVSLTNAAAFSLLVNLAPGSANTTNFNLPLVKTGVQGTLVQAPFWVFAVAGARRLDPLRAEFLTSTFCCPWQLSSTGLP